MIQARNTIQSIPKLPSALVITILVRFLALLHCALFGVSRDAAAQPNPSSFFLRDLGYESLVVRGIRNSPRHTFHLLIAPIGSFGVTLGVIPRAELHLHGRDC